MSINRILNLQLSRNMDYKCNFCSKYFSQVKVIISHLKKDHKVIENTERIPCLVNFPDGIVCQRSYLSFSALQKHMKPCVLNRQVYAMIKYKHPIEFNSFHI